MDYRYSAGSWQYRAGTASTVESVQITKRAAFNYGPTRLKIMETRGLTRLGSTFVYQQEHGCINRFLTIVRQSVREWTKPVDRDLIVFHANIRN
jgi:hypothetical protein